jgi:hypothetical protein
MMVSTLRAAPLAAFFGLALAPGLAFAEPPAPCPPRSPAPTESPRSAAVLAGADDRYAPLARFSFGERCMVLELPVTLGSRFEDVGAVALDRAGNELDRGVVIAPRARIAATFDSGTELRPALHAEYEHDLVTGFIAGDPAVPGDGYPTSHELDMELRKLNARVSFAPWAHLSLGLTTSHWGMGLLANDGDHGYQPGSARFADPRGGDRLLRAALATGPHTGAGLLVALGGDIVHADDSLLAGDEAKQLFGAITLGAGKPTTGGAYVVRRFQKTETGARTDVWVTDATAKTRIELGRTSLTLEGEGALITGTSELAPTANYPEHDVLQLGLAARTSLERGAFGMVLDFLYASGDQNLDDGEQNGFRVDPNHETGLLLYRHVLAAQSARGAVTAADPELVGLPSKNLERVPTRGNLTNTIALFPRLRFRPLAGLELYGGPLFAFAAVPLADPLNSRLAGGVPRGPLGGEGGSYLGTELDLGVRYRALVRGVQLDAGLEGGTLRPGSAMRREDGGPMNAVHGGRMMLEVRL